MALPDVPFWFLRHGETDYNALGLSQGALDISLNDNGRAQALAAGPKLVGQEIVSIMSSPMIRTRETTECVNSFLNLPVAYEPGLREVIFGGMEGKPLMPWFAEWLEGHFTPDGAESFAEVTARVAEAMTRVLVLPSPVLVVAHGGVFRALRELMGRAGAEGMAQNAAPLFCNPTSTGWQINPA